MSKPQSISTMRFSWARQLLRVIAFSLVSAFALTVIVTATTWLPPLRTLTTDERVELGVSGSQAIGVGQVIAVHDSLDADGVPWRWMTFAPKRWLKGAASPSNTRIYFSQITSYCYNKIAAWPSRPAPSCIVFIRRAGNLWVLAESPSMPGGGVMRLGSNVDEIADEAAVVRGIARQAPEEIARRSALIVVGKTVQRGAVCVTHGNAVKCADVVVDSVITGTLPPGVIHLHTLFGGFDTYDHVLLMLRPDGSGGFENVGFSGGTLPIVDGQVNSLGLSAQDLIGRLRQATAAAAGERSVKP